MEFQPLLGNQQLHSRLQAALRQERAAHPADPQKAADQHASDC